MKISIFGLGYVGCVSAGCLAELGHTVIGVDTDPFKVDLLNSGKPTIIEEGISELILKHHKRKKISATTDYVKAVMNSDVSFICVGTPNSAEGHLNMEYIDNVSLQISLGIKKKNKFHVIIIRSTVHPGTNRRISKLVEKKSGKKNLVDFCIISNPEFLREGNAVNDYFNPSLTVAASDSPEGLKILRKIYNKINSPFIIVDIEIAEILKFINNTYHALKISFANEVGMICKSLNIDAIKLMEIFTLDTKLNASGAYLRPGFAFGGSCLPKDLKALNTMAHDNYINTPVIQNIDYSNNIIKKNLFDTIKDKGMKSIGIAGISFKEGTDDLRNSPIIDVIEKLLGKGLIINVYDENINLSNLIGTNKNYIFTKLPHINSLLFKDVCKFIEKSEVIVMNSKDINIISLLKNKYKDKIIIDLVYIKELMHLKNYKGYYW